MKKYVTIIFLLFSGSIKAQKIEAIFVNLYTDSLKKGTYNYINVDGLLHDGSYLPLDSTQIKFESAAGKFLGNSLWIDPNFTAKKVTVKVTLKQNPALHKEFDIWIKQKPDGPLRTVEEILSDMKKPKKKN